MELYAIGPFWSSFQALECQHVNSIWASQSWWWLPHEIHRWSKALWTPTLSIGWRRELVEFAARWLRGLERACHDVCWWLDGCCTWWRWWKINRLYEFFFMWGTVRLYDVVCEVQFEGVCGRPLEPWDKDIYTRFCWQDTRELQIHTDHTDITQISHRYHTNHVEIQYLFGSCYLRTRSDGLVAAPRNRQGGRWSRESHNGGELQAQCLISNASACRWRGQPSLIAKAPIWHTP